MAKRSTSVAGMIPAYGTIIVIPEIRTKETATVVLAISDQSLPIGRVVAIGDVPGRYKKVPIGIGSLIAYSKAVTQSVPIEIDGQMTNVMCVQWSDTRVFWTDENKKHEGLISIRDIIMVGTGVAIGIAFRFRNYIYPFLKLYYRSRVALGSGFKKWFFKRDKGVVPGEGNDIRPDV